MLRARWYFPLVRVRVLVHKDFNAFWTFVQVRRPAPSLHDVAATFLDIIWMITNISKPVGALCDIRWEDIITPIANP